MQRGWAARLPRLAAWALFAAIFPTLTYMGHWPREVPVTGTHFYLWLGPPGDVRDEGAAPDDSEEGATHERHCHGSPASCTDVPFTGASGFGLLNEWLALAGVSGLLVALAGRWWRPGRPFVPGLELRPPRAALS